MYVSLRCFLNCEIVNCEMANLGNTGLNSEKRKKVSVELGKPHQALSVTAAPRPQPELLVALLGSAASAESDQAESSEPPTMAFGFIYVSKFLLGCLGHL